MADAALAQALGAMKIEKRVETSQQHANHHVLSMEYPAFNSSIQPAERVQFDPPATIGHRSKPPVDMNTLALYNTHFTMALPLQKPATWSYKPREEYMKLVAAVEALKGGAGHTLLGAVKVHQEIWDQTVYRVRLQTEWLGPFPKHPPQDFELSIEEWETLISYAGQRTWIALLQHLVERASAEAYYHVRQRIEAKFGARGVEEEEGTWPVAWESKPKKDAQELFWDRLNIIYENVLDGKMPQVLLECGHASHLTGVQATSVSSSNVFWQVCERCNVGIMRLEDKLYLSHVAEKERVWRYQRMQQVWADLASSVRHDEPAKRFHVMSIFHVLGAALDSLRTPETVAPSAICPTHFEETKLVLEHLESMFYGQHRFYERTAEQMLEELEHEALGVRIGNATIGERVNPPGWDEFLAKWLRRSAYFLAYRRCERCNGLHRHGLHWHDRGGLWYDPAEWEEAEARRFDGQAHASSMMDLMRSLDKTHI